MFPTLPPILNELLTPLVLLVLTTLAGIVTVLVKQLGTAAIAWITAHIGVQKMTLLKNAIDACVATLNQSPAFSQYSNDEKKTYSLIYAMQFAAQQGITIAENAVTAQASKYGLTITKADLDKIIEASVSAWKTGQAVSQIAQLQKEMAAPLSTATSTTPQ
jgi:hypothetical protein